MPRDGSPGRVDPYSSSKACSELVVSAYRRSFFHPDRLSDHGVALATARAGNVVGGGDWASDRLVPDIMRAFSAGARPLIRLPDAVRPWQHVLEPLSGYMLLAERLWHGETIAADAWNFGAAEEDARPVSWIADRLSALWGDGAGWDMARGPQPYEATCLKLDSSKARALLGWRPAWLLEKGLSETVSWHRAALRNEDMREVTRGRNSVVFACRHRRG